MDEKLMDFADDLHYKIKEMLVKDKINNLIIVGLLQKEIYNIHRTMECNPKLIKEIVEKIIV